MAPVLAAGCEVGALPVQTALRARVSQVPGCQCSSYTEQDTGRGDTGRGVARASTSSHPEGQQAGLSSASKAHVWPVRQQMPLNAASRDVGHW